MDGTGGPMGHAGPRFFHMPRLQAPPGGNRPNYMHSFRQHMLQNQNLTFDGKRMRKAVYRKTVDYNSSVLNFLENRVWQRDFRDQRGLMTDPLYVGKMLPPPNLLYKPMNCVTTKFIRISTNKIRCPIFCVAWTPEGRRLITGASSGEFTLWNGLTFNFETILQAHDTSVRSMVWSHNDLWMLTADHGGFIKYWQSNMNNVKMYQAHKDPIRGISFCPTDQKFASCSDDGTVRIWDFLRCHEEKILRGHGADVKCVDWHPQKSLVVSGSKDTQQPVKLWDPRSGSSLATIHAHKHTVMEVKWNNNGNWLLTASRDHLLKLYDVRKLKEELQTFKGHKKEATTVAWNPIHENLFVSGGSDGSMMFWLVGHDKEVGSIDEAHETMVWSLAWHPLGHILASGSNDHTTKFWTRNRPGDRMRDRYNLNTLPIGMSEEMLDYDDPSLASIPGMGLEYGLPEHLRPQEPEEKKEDAVPSIPGLDWETTSAQDKPAPRKKVPYAKPIPKQFEQAWTSGLQPGQKEEKQPLIKETPSGLAGPRPLLSLPTPSEPPPGLKQQGSQLLDTLTGGEQGQGQGPGPGQSSNQNAPPQPGQQQGQQQWQPGMHGGPPQGQKSGPGGQMGGSRGQMGGPQGHMGSPQGHMGGPPGQMGGARMPAPGGGRAPLLGMRPGGTDQGQQQQEQQRFGGSGFGNQSGGGRQGGGGSSGPNNYGRDTGGGYGQNQGMENMQGGGSQGGFRNNVTGNHGNQQGNYGGNSGGNQQGGYGNNNNGNRDYQQDRNSGQGSRNGEYKNYGDMGDDYNNEPERYGDKSYYGGGEDTRGRGRGRGGGGRGFRGGSQDNRNRALLPKPGGMDQNQGGGRKRPWDEGDEGDQDSQEWGHGPKQSRMDSYSGGQEFSQRGGRQRGSWSGGQGPPRGGRGRGRGGSSWGRGGGGRGR